MIVVVTAKKRVVAVTAIDDIVTGAANDRIGPRSAIEDVSGIAAVQLRRIAERLGRPTVEERKLAHWSRNIQDTANAEPEVFDSQAGAAPPIHQCHSICQLIE